LLIFALFRLCPERRLFNNELTEGCELELFRLPMRLLSVPEAVPANKPPNRLLVCVSAVKTGLTLVLIKLKILEAMSIPYLIFLKNAIFIFIFIFIFSAALF